MRYKLFSSHRLRAFTLPEVMLSVALIGIIAGMSVPLYRIFLVRNDLDIATVTVAQNLRRAQSLSKASDGDMTWGVRVGVGSILIYKGANFVSRDSLFDENTSIPTSIVVSGLSELTFSKTSGYPSATGTMTLTSQNSEVRKVIINEKGTIDY